MSDTKIWVRIEISPGLSATCMTVDTSMGESRTTLRHKDLGVKLIHEEQLEVLKFENFIRFWEDFIT